MTLPVVMPSIQMLLLVEMLILMILLLEEIAILLLVMMQMVNIRLPVEFLLMLPIERVLKKSVATIISSGTSIANGDNATNNKITNDERLRTRCQNQLTYWHDTVCQQRKQDTKQPPHSTRDSKGTTLSSSEVSFRHKTPRYLETLSAVQ